MSKRTKEYYIIDADIKDGGVVITIDIDRAQDELPGWIRYTPLPLAPPIPKPVPSTEDALKSRLGSYVPHPDDDPR